MPRRSHELACASATWTSTRLELARGQGATDGSADTVQRVLDETGGFGADFTFESSGLVDVMRQAGPVHDRRRGRQGPFVSHRITLDEVNRGFELMEAGTGSAR
jgi:Zn-dependent alcohol dehydrogenase